MGKRIVMTDELYEYMRQVSFKESETLQRLRKATLKVQKSWMQITPEQGQFMGWLVKVMGAKRCIELGVYTGYSAIAVAQNLPDDGVLVACDTSEEWTDMAKPFWIEAGVIDKIDLRIAPAMDTLDLLIEQGEAESYDFSFVDADKCNYLAYYERLLKLLRPGGVIIVDNVFQEGRVADPSETDKRVVAIREFNQRLYADNRIEISMIPMSDGLTLVRKC